MSASNDALRLLREVDELIPQFQQKLTSPIAQFPSEELRLLAHCGALAAALPRSAGGLGFGIDGEMFAPFLHLLREMGRSNLVIGRIFEGHVNALLLIHRHGTSEQVGRAAGDVHAKKCVFGVWNTGPAGQPSVEQRPNGNYRFSGGKTFASGAGKIQRAIVTGALEGEGWRMFVLPLDELECRIDTNSWHPIGMEASESFAIDLTGIEVERTALLGQAEEYYSEPFFTGGAFRFSAVQLGGAEALVDFCRRYLREMHYEKDPHQLHRMGRMSVAMESGRLWIEQAARWLEHDDGCVECLKTRARMMRVATLDICTQVIEMVEMSVGARGLEGARPTARMLRDLQMYLRQAGVDNTLTAVGQAAMEAR